MISSSVGGVVVINRNNDKIFGMYFFYCLCLLFEWISVDVEVMCCGDFSLKIVVIWKEGRLIYFELLM